MRRVTQKRLKALVVVAAGLLPTKRTLRLVRRRYCRNEPLLPATWTPFLRGTK